MSAVEALEIVQDVIATRNRDSLALTFQPTLGFDSLLTAVEQLALAVVRLEVLA